MKNNKEQINHQKTRKKDMKGLEKKKKKKRNLNIEEHYKIENNHYHYYESQKPKQYNKTSKCPQHSLCSVTADRNSPVAYNIVIRKSHAELPAYR